MKARDVVTRALQLIGVLDATEVGDAADLMTSLGTLNDMLDTWSTERLTILASTLEQFALTAGDGIYTVGPAGDMVTAVPVEVLDQSFVTINGVDYPLQIITEQQYNSIGVKYSQGIPTALFYRPGASLGTLTLWRVPSVAATLSLASWKPLTGFADLDTDYTFAPGYKRAMQYNLAVELCLVFARPVDPDIRRIAASSMRALKRMNAVVPRLSIDSALYSRPLMNGLPQ